MDIRDIAKAAREQGWTVDRTSRGHWRFIPPTKAQGGPFIHSGTASDRRAIRNFLALLRRAGLEHPPRRK